MPAESLAWPQRAEQLLQNAAPLTENQLKASLIFKTRYPSEHYLLQAGSALEGGKVRLGVKILYGLTGTCWVGGKVVVGV